MGTSLLVRRNQRGVGEKAGPQNNAAAFEAAYEASASAPAQRSRFLGLHLVHVAYVPPNFGAMSGTPQQIVNDDCLNESWVELYYGASSSDRATPPLSGNVHILEKLLLEAQRDSNASSARGSGSPKSPHSPSNETVSFVLNKQEEKQIPTDWIWDWSSRPDQQPPKDWKFRHPGVVANRKRPVLSLRGSRIIRLADIFPLLLLSNLLSVLLGAGIGVCIGRRMRVASVE
ncbi:hypothetical protein ISCGN_021078 [Ixodes scapularis]